LCLSLTLTGDGRLPLQQAPFLAPRLRSQSFRFCVSILLLAFYLCIVYPHIGNLTNFAGYPPLKPKIIFCDYLLDHNLSLSMDHQFKEDRKMVPWLKISSISPKEKYFQHLLGNSVKVLHTRNIGFTEIREIALGWEVQFGSCGMFCKFTSKCSKETTKLGLCTRILNPFQDVWGPRNTGVRNLRNSGIMNLRSSGIMNLRSSGIMNLRSSGMMNLQNSEIKDLWSSGIYQSLNSEVMMYEDLRIWESRKPARSQVKDVASKV
jgi:hypothetical protein